MIQVLFRERDHQQSGEKLTSLVEADEVAPFQGRSNVLNHPITYHPRSESA